MPPAMYKVCTSTFSIFHFSSAIGLQGLGNVRSTNRKQPDLDPAGPSYVAPMQRGTLAFDSTILNLNPDGGCA